MLSKLRRWAKLASSDRAAVLEAWLLLLLAQLSIRWLDPTRTESLLRRILPPRRREAESTATIAARLRGLIAAAAANHLRPSRCLERSLVLRAMLSRRGHDAELCIGARRLGGELEAHAWVECDGEPIAENELEGGGYSTLLPAASAR